MKLNVVPLFFAAALGACAHSPMSAAPALRQFEHTAPVALLQSDGFLATAGWARKGVFRYDRERVAVPKNRLREWDFFTVMTSSHALNITLANIGFAAFCSVDLVELATGDTIAGAVAHLQPVGNVIHRATSEDTAYCLLDGKPVMVLSKSGSRRTAWFDLPASFYSKRVRGRIEMEQPESMDYAAVVLPFPGDQRRFFYENKIPGLPAAGVVEADGKVVGFPQGEAYAVMDWGRGVWPQRVFWRWGAAASNDLSFNLGDGFGDTSRGTENLLVIAGKGHKLGALTWKVDRGDYRKPWRFVAEDGSAELTLEPVHEQAVDVNAAVKAAELHKVYGYFSGFFILQDGTRVPVDRVLGFAEEMNILW